VCGSLGCKPEERWPCECVKLRRSDVEGVRGNVRTINSALLRHRFLTSSHLGVLDFRMIGDIWLAPHATNHHCSAANRSH